MKKRVHIPAHARTLRTSSMGGAAVHQLDPQAPASGENLPGLAIVPGPQFDALLDLLERPSEVSIALRREVAERRWK